MKCERCGKSMHGFDPDEAYCDSCREIVLAEEAGDDDEGDDVIDRNFQPCYVDGCPERGTVDIEIRPRVWRDFCPAHAAEWRKAAKPNKRR